ncbi:MAG: outer membrane beta-barrel domain-containing protein [Proteobacteria bacterium]|nr:outer membrane beta-barrel domain-containing protein [Pseudomonadota bacterium]
MNVARAAAASSPRRRAHWVWSLRVIALAACLAASVSGARRASAKKRVLWEETDKLPAVQNRRYRVQHEFAAAVGTLPADPYTKGLTLSGSYGWHLNDLWAIEARGHWVRNFNSALRDKLEGNFGTDADRFDKIKFFGQLGGLFKPLYGKFSFLNDQQVYGEFFLSLHGVVAQLDGGGGSADDPVGRGQRLAFGASPGFGVRGFLSEHWSLRLDISWLVLFAETGETHLPLLLTFSLAGTTRSDS